MRNLFPLLFFATGLGAQSGALSLQSLLDSAEARSLTLERFSVQEEISRTQYLAGYIFQPLQVQYTWGQIDGPFQDYQFQFQQSLGNPFALGSRIALQNSATELARLRGQSGLFHLQANIYQAYAGWYFQSRMAAHSDSLSQELKAAAEQMGAQSEAGALLAAEYLALRRDQLAAKHRSIRLSEAARSDRDYLELACQCSIDGYYPERPPLWEKELEEGQLFEAEQEAQALHRQSQRKLANRDRLPGFFLGYTNQQLNLIPGFEAYTLGAQIPLFPGSTQQEAQLAKLREAEEKLKRQELSQQRQLERARLKTKKIQLQQSLSQADLPWPEALRQVKMQYAAGALSADRFAKHVQDCREAAIEREQLWLALYRTQAQLNHLNASTP